MIKFLVFVIGLGVIFFWFKEPIKKVYDDLFSSWFNDSDGASSVLSGDAGLKESDLDVLNKSSISGEERDYSEKKSEKS